MCRSYEIMPSGLTEQTGLPTLHPTILNPPNQTLSFPEYWLCPPLWPWSPRFLITSADRPCDVPFPGPTTSSDPHHTRRPSLQAPHPCNHLYGPRLPPRTYTLTRQTLPMAPHYLYSLSTLPPLPAPADLS